MELHCAKMFASCACYVCMGVYGCVDVGVLLCTSLCVCLSLHMSVHLALVALCDACYGLGVVCVCACSLSLWPGWALLFFCPSDLCTLPAGFLQALLPSL